MDTGRLYKINLQLKSRRTRGSQPRALEAAEITALEQRRDEIMAHRKPGRAVAKVNAHTSAEADRVNAHTASVVAGAVADVKQSSMQTFCPAVAASASPKQKVRALKARHNIERGLIAQLQQEAREEAELLKKSKLEAGAKPRPKRAAAKAPAATKAPAAAKAPAATKTSASSSSAGPTDARPVKRLCGAPCVGTRNRAGDRFCKQPCPCRHHKVAVPAAEVAEPEVAVPEFAERKDVRVPKFDAAAAYLEDLEGMLTEPLGEEARAEALEWVRMSKEDKHRLGLVATEEME